MARSKNQNVPFSYQGFVDRLGWLTAEEFLSGFALSKLTPGPVATTATFVGFKVGGLLGALIATVGVFLPGFVMVLFLGPFFERIRSAPGAQGPKPGIEIAAIGTILAAAADLIQGSLTRWSAVGAIGLALALSWKMEAGMLILTMGVLGAIACLVRLGQ
ncbi:MAG: chromate transporter [Nitrospinota bacterium]